MKGLFTGLFVCALVCSVLVPSPTMAETAQQPSGLFAYDISKEVTFTATVSSVITKPTKGFLMGSHLLLANGSGSIDASLGSFGLQGKGAPSIAAGQQVEVTGVMKTIKNQQVFFTRLMKVNGETFTLRNQHGVPLSPEARERLSLKNAGGAL